MVIPFSGPELYVSTTKSMDWALTTSQSLLGLAIPVDRLNDPSHMVSLMCPAQGWRYIQLPADHIEAIKVLKSHAYEVPGSSSYYIKRSPTTQIRESYVFQDYTYLFQIVKLNPFSIKYFPTALSFGLTKQKIKKSNLQENKQVIAITLVIHVQQYRHSICSKVKSW